MACDSSPKRGAKCRAKPCRSPICSGAVRTGGPSRREPKPLDRAPPDKSPGAAPGCRVRLVKRLKAACCSAVRMPLATGFMPPRRRGCAGSRSDGDSEQLTAFAGAELQVILVSIQAGATTARSGFSRVSKGERSRCVPSCAGRCLRLPSLAFRWRGAGVAAVAALRPLRVRAPVRRRHRHRRLLRGRASTT